MWFVSLLTKGGLTLDKMDFPTKCISLVQYEVFTCPNASNCQWIWFQNGLVLAYLVLDLGMYFGSLNWVEMHYLISA